MQFVVCTIKHEGELTRRIHIMRALYILHRKNNTNFKYNNYRQHVFVYCIQWSTEYLLPDFRSLGGNRRLRTPWCYPGSPKFFTTPKQTTWHTIATQMQRWDFPSLNSNVCTFYTLHRYTIKENSKYCVRIENTNDGYTGNLNKYSKKIPSEELDYGLTSLAEVLGKRRYKYEWCESSRFLSNWLCKHWPYRHYGTKTDMHWPHSVNAGTGMESSLFFTCPTPDQ